MKQKYTFVDGVLDFDDSKSVKELIEYAFGKVVINGNHTFMDIVHDLKRSGYIDSDCEWVKVLPIGVAQTYSISFSDPVMKMPLKEFVKTIDLHHKKYLKLHIGDFIVF